MGTTTHEVHLPTGGDPGQVLGAFHSLMRAFGIELGSRYDEFGQRTIGPNWFAALLAMRPDEKLGPTLLYDPSFVLKEPLWHSDSPTRRCLPSGGQFYNLVENLVHVRNSWAHHVTEPTLASLADAVVVIHELATSAQLKVSAPASAMRKRIKQLLDGTWAPDAVVEAPATITTEPLADEVVEAIDEETKASVAKGMRHDPVPRPPVGGEWVGELPSQRLRLTKLNEVVDADTGEALTALLGDEAGATIDHWKSLRPMGDLYLDDDDAAVVAYLAGVPRLIGYLGPEPDGAPEEIRGFAIPALYRVTETQIIDAATEASLAAVASEDASEIISKILENVRPGGTIRVTNYGDIVRINETGKVKIAHATPETWFPGQIG